MPTQCRLSSCVAISYLLTCLPETARYRMSLFAKIRGSRLVGARATAGGGTEQQADSNSNVAPHAAGRLDPLLADWCTHASACHQSGRAAAGEVPARKALEPKKPAGRLLEPVLEAGASTLEVGGGTNTTRRELVGRQ